MKKRDIYITLIVLCVLAFANTFRNEFVSDDLADILQNQFLGDPWRVWLVPHNFLNSICFLAARHNPVVYHAVSIFFHAVNTILVFHFLRLFFRERGSFLGAALFAVHPVHVEAITWISGRPYAIVAFFVLTTFFLYYYAMNHSAGAGPTCPEARRGGSRTAPTINCLTGAGMTEKEDGQRLQPGINYRLYGISLIVYTYFLYKNYAFYFLFPVFIALFDFTFGRISRTWKWLIPFFIILAVRLLMAKMAVSGRVVSIAREMGGGVVWTNPLFNLVYSFFSHLGLMLWPSRLSLYHEPPVITVFWLRAGIAALIVLAFALIYFFKRQKEIFLAICMFGLFLAPTYSPVTISWLLAERYLYVPSIALSICFALLYDRWIARSKALRRTGLSLCLLVIAAYGVRTIARNEDWKTPERLWRSTVEVTPMSPRAHNNMGDVYAREGSFEGAIREFKQSIDLKPGYADPYHNLANIYDVLGNFDEAVKYYLQALEINPELHQSYRNLGNIYLRQGNHDLAQQYLQKAQETQSKEFAQNYSAYLVNNAAVAQ